MPRQTCKTILFEEFNRSPSVPDLFTILNNNPSNDELAQELQKLTVHSFSEFMEKFAPTVYEVPMKVDGKVRFIYTLDRKKFKGAPAIEIRISEHEYYKMLSRMYSDKGARGKSNLSFDDSDILEILTPKQGIQEILDTRRQFQYNMQRYYEAEERGESTEKFQRKVSECRKKVRERFTKQSSAILPILIDDINTKLKRLEQAQLPGGEQGSGLALPSPGQCGQLFIDDNGRLEVKALPPPSEQSSEQSDQKAEAHDIPKEIAAAVAKDYDKRALVPSTYVRNMLVSIYAPTAGETGMELSTEVIEQQRAELITRRDELEESYCNAKESFIRELSSLIERLMDVKIFFDHATVEGGNDGILPEGLIVSNCKASKLLEIDEKFTKYMEFLGKDQGSNRIWFAIVPSVLEAPPQKTTAPKKGGPLDDDDDDDEDVPNRKNFDAEYVSINALSSILGIMEQAKILTVFNIRAEHGNTFADMTKHTVAQKIKELDPIGGAHSVYAYPNFTLTRERPGFKPFAPYSNRTISLPGIYIDAAYPAAGLLVGSQQHDYLNAHGFSGKVIKENPCVRIDFETLEMKRNLHTKLNRESEFQADSELMRAINERMFGFMFSSDEVIEDGVTWKNAFVHCARTFEKNKDGIYKSIYKTLTADYISQELMLSGDQRRSGIRRTLGKLNSESDKQNGMPQTAGAVNILFRTGEKVMLDENDKVHVTFLDDDSIIADFNVISD